MAAFIVTTGKIIKVDLSSRFRFECSSEHPGMVKLYDRKNDNFIELPGNPKEAKDFCLAYLRCVDEELGYRKQECESDDNYDKLTNSVINKEKYE